MKWTSIVAIYALFWVLSAFLVMPFGVRSASDHDDHERVVGQADSAPVNFRPGRIALRTTILSAVLFGFYYLNYVYGWVTPGDLNLFPAPDFNS